MCSENLKIIDDFLFNHILILSCENNFLIVKRFYLIILCLNNSCNIFKNREIVQSNSWPFTNIGQSDLA